MTEEQKIFPIDTKKLTIAGKFLAICGGVLFIIIGIAVKQWYSVAAGMAIVPAVMMGKDVYIDQDGIKTRFNLILLSKEDNWYFKEIKEIHTEFSPNYDKCALHFMKEIMSKRLVFSINDYQAVLDMALRKNPKIHVSSVNKG